MSTIEPPAPPPPPSPSSSFAPTAPPPYTPTPVMPVRTEKPVIRAVEVGGLLLAGFALNLALRSSLSTLVTAIGIVVVGAMLLLAGRLEQRSSRLLVLGAMALAPWLALRGSNSLTAVTILAIAALLAVAVGVSRNGSLTRLPTFAIVNHLAAQSLEWVYGFGMVRRLTAGRGKSRQWSALIRGFVVALPIVGLFALLLASADEVFASVLSVNGLPTVVGHLFLTLAIAVVLLGLVSRAAHETEPISKGPGRMLSTVEVKVVLGSVALLFSAFVATQIAVAAGGVDHVLETAGLTQAEHARSGFFQLLWVAGLTLGMLATIRALRLIADDDNDSVDDVADEDNAVEPLVSSPDRFVPLSAAILLLTLAITGISIQRLLFYVGSFGLTPLRLWALVGAGWIGLMLLGYGVVILRATTQSERDRTSPFPAMVLISAAVVVFGLNVLNPDSFVTRYNLSELPADQVDLAAIGTLSADNIGVIEDNIDDLDGLDQSTLLRFVCARAQDGVSRQRGRAELQSQPYGFLSWNWAESAENNFLAARCGATQPTIQ